VGGWKRAARVADGKPYVCRWGCPMTAGRPPTAGSDTFLYSAPRLAAGSRGGGRGGGSCTSASKSPAPTRCVAAMGRRPSPTSLLPPGRSPSPRRAARPPPSSIRLVTRGGAVGGSAPSPRPRTVNSPPAARRPLLPLGRSPSPGRAALAPPSSIRLVGRGGALGGSTPSLRPRTVDAPPAARPPRAAGPLVDVATRPPPDERRAVGVAAVHAPKSSQAGGDSHRPPRPVAARWLYPPPHRLDGRWRSLGCAAAATAARMGGGGGLAALGAGASPPPPATAAMRQVGARQTAQRVSWLSKQRGALARADHTRPRSLCAGGGEYGRTYEGRVQRIQPRTATCCRRPTQSATADVANCAVHRVAGSTTSPFFLQIARTKTCTTPRKRLCKAFFL